MASGKRDLSLRRKFLIDHLSKDPFMVESEVMLILKEKPAGAPLTLKECTEALKAHRMNDTYHCNPVASGESKDWCFDEEGKAVRKLCYSCSFYVYSENFLKFFCKNLKK